MKSSENAHKKNPFHSLSDIDLRNLITNGNPAFHWAIPTSLWTTTAPLKKAAEACLVPTSHPFPFSIYHAPLA